MAHQTTLRRDSGNGVLGGIEDLGNNLITLATLQARLAVQDCRESGRRGLPALIASAVLIPVALASTTAALFGAAYWLAADRVLSFGPALLVVAAAGLVVSALLSVFAVRTLRHSFDSFLRSREELERNIAWLGTVLSRSGR
jgi:hypothetical protein